MTFHEQDSKIKAKKKRQAVPCIAKKHRTGQRGEIAMKILNGKVFENGKFVEKEVATDGSLFCSRFRRWKGNRRSGLLCDPGTDRYSVFMVAQESISVTEP